MKFKMRIYYDSKVAVCTVIPDEDTIKHLGKETVSKILNNGKIEFVEEVSQNVHIAKESKDV